MMYSKVTVSNVASKIDFNDSKGAADELIFMRPSQKPTQPDGILKLLWQSIMAKSLVEETDDEIIQDLNDCLTRYSYTEGTWFIYENFERLRKKYPDHRGLIFRVYVSILLTRADIKQQWMLREVLRDAHQILDTPTYERFFYVILEIDGFIPSFWNFREFVSKLKFPASRELAMKMALVAKRPDLITYFELLTALAQTSPISEIDQLLANIESSAEFNMAAEYLLVVPTGIWSVELVEKYVNRFSKSDVRSVLDFLPVRRAYFEENWTKVIGVGRQIEKQSPFKSEADFAAIRAALKMDDLDLSDMLLVKLEANGQLPHYAQIRRDRHDLLRRKPKNLKPTNIAHRLPNPKNGAPLAQALWVGSSLRELDLISIESFLRNGWRFQLYVYEMPNNVPSGVEVLDANMIVPQSELAIEGSISGLHKGSLGAFSDLFRYALLERRGGLWVDTDIINILPFDPENQRFVTSEFTTGLEISLNGAMLSAPANDEFISKLLQSAKAAWTNPNAISFADIGPRLLVQEMGQNKASENFKIMSVDFLNPISWSQSGVFLQPIEKFSDRFSLKNSTNLHLYSETWRINGFDFSKPLPDQSLIGRISREFQRSDPQRTTAEIFKALQLI